MKTLRVTWKGISPLIMHSCKAVNPLHPIAKEMKKISAKKTKKTEDDIQKLADLEWEAGAYWQDDIGLYIPAENIEATIRNGGKARKKGKDFQKYVNVAGLMVPFNYGENLTKEELMKRYDYRDTRCMVVQRSRVTRTRPRFDRWSITFDLTYDEKGINLSDVADAMEYAGLYVGLCDSRPKYGRFVPLVEELD